MIQPTKAQLLYVPLGGTGEIGMNLNLYGHGGAWLMADCGMMVSRRHGRQIILPDPAFIEARRDDLVGIVLTHAHMDHIGALPWLWQRLRCPIYATRFTAALVARQLMAVLPETDLEVLPLHILDPGSRRLIGPFDVQWVTLTHSIPEPNALYIRTAAGDVFHTGDWKLDEAPVVGSTTDVRTIKDIGKSAVGAMVCDSTNATVDGVSGSESSIIDTLEALIGNATGRVVVTCFASNVARLVTLARAAIATGRRLSVHGRSIEQMLGVARACGYFDEPCHTVPARHVAYLPRDEVLALVTGSQGEPAAALGKFAHGVHRDFDLEAGDSVIFSAKRIPGNEAAIDRTIEALRERGVHVTEDGAVATHVSGHPAREELRILYGWLRPRLVVPTHGEAVHLEANCRLAKRCGATFTLNARNGDVCLIGGGPPGIVGKVPVGRLMVDR